MHQSQFQIIAVFCKIMVRRNLRTLKWNPRGLLSNFGSWTPASEYNNSHFCTFGGCGIILDTNWGIKRQMTCQIYRHSCRDDSPLVEKGDQRGLNLRIFFFSIQSRITGGSTLHEKSPKPLQTHHFVTRKANRKTNALILLCYFEEERERGKEQPRDVFHDLCAQQTAAAPASMRERR